MQKGKNEERMRKEDKSIFKSRYYLGALGADACEQNRRSESNPQKGTQRD